LIYNFENYTLDVDRQELRRGSNRLSVEPQVLDLLHYLIRNRDRVVSKDDLIAHVWNGRIVSDSTLTSRITSARHAVGDNGDDQRLIRTVARKGIRFVGEVRENPAPTSVEATRSAAAAVGLRLSSQSAGAPRPQLPDKPSIAVLPFTNMSGDPEQEYFSDGISEDIISALSRLHWLFVIARNSAFVYKGHAVDVKQVGADLGVRYVLEGSVRKSGQRVRIASQLLDALTGDHIWAERYDRELSDIFALQDEITTSVTAAIEPKLLAAEGIRTETRSIEDLSAWDLVARALSHFWKLTPAESATAIAILRQAVERHPNYAPAHSMLAFALLVAGYMGWIPGAADRKFVTQLARRAVELDEDDPWAYMALGMIAWTDRQTDEAVRRFQTAISLNPNFAAAYGYIGLALVFDGQSDEALRYFEQVMRMSPRDPSTHFFAGISVAHYMAGRYPDAVRWGRQALQQRPGILSGHRILCASLAQAGQIDEAKAVLSMLRQMQPNLSIAWIRQWVPYTAGPMEHFLAGLRKAGLTE
jgi:TolB-like protein/Flp pilus assembly protein TadD